MYDPKYVVSFPKGGFISMIRSINDAYKYAVKYNRVLIIDCRKNWFKESIYDYFFIHSPHVYVGDINFLYKKIQPLSMYPKQVDLIGVNDLDDRTFNINLDRDYDEQIVIYSHFGRDESIRSFFELVSLKPEIYKSYMIARDRLPSSYVGVHISNINKVDEFLELRRQLLKDKTVFIASPAKEVVDRFKKEFNALSFSDVPYKNDEEPVGVDNHKYNTDTIVDLLLLASSSELYCGSTSYCRAAVELHEDPVLLKRLLTESFVKD